ncbi:phage tail sheath C-terminal domain-containing protein [Serratia rhizosphaerae]|uniref:Phage tail protein n=1 Tax=Serratia rhizosphaerae TaxID=2597702 RepID=A0ABX6GHD2_9GAMM|nr:phage tail sheath C-terminal domain-containing protein [Serratia rhizosphaerae]QHA85682.1 phage tail protein [Serratia rhizosphaerae]
MELHGVRTLEDDSAPKQITTVNMSVIGLVGTAPDAESGTAATLSTGSSLLDNQVVFTATAAGTAGNQLQVRAVAGEADSSAGAETGADFEDGVLTITLGTDAEGVVDANAADVVAAVNALMFDAEDMGIDAALPDGMAGAGVVAPFGLMALQGGEDEPFPLYTPALIAGSRNQAKKLGYGGTLYDDMNDILNQIGALVIVVRVDTDEDEEAQRANILQGIASLQLGQSTLNYQPRILIAPEWSTDDGVGRALESMAARCRAIAYLDSPSMATPEAVVRRGQMYGARVELLRPRINVVSDLTGKTRTRPYSAAAAGHRVRIDSTRGYWWSKSNQMVLGFTGLEQVDSFMIGDETCVANQLNQANVSTLVQLDGFRHWGNRLCTDDPQWRFEAVRRTMDAIEDSIQLSVTKEYLDAPISKSLGVSMLGSINSYLRQQVTGGVIIGGSAWLDEELNTAESLAAGIVYINVAVTPKSPAEQIVIKYAINKNTGQVSLAA